MSKRPRQPRNLVNELRAVLPAPDPREDEGIFCIEFADFHALVQTDGKGGIIGGLAVANSMLRALGEKLIEVASAEAEVVTEGHNGS